MNLKICILLPWDINNDSRAQRTALTLSLYHKVHVFHIAEKNTISELLSSIEITKIPPVNRTVKDRFFLPFHSSSRALKEKLITCVNNYNVIYCHDLPALFALKGIDLKNQKIVYDIHDLYLETINQSLAPAGSSQAQKIKHKIAIFLFRFFIKKIEQKLIKGTHLNFSVNNSISNYIKSVYKVNCETIENFPILRPFPKEMHLRKSLNIPSDKKIVLYHGNLGGGRYLSEIVASALFYNDTICLVIMGKGQLLTSLKSEAAPNVFFLDSVPYNNLFEYAADANLGIVLLENINYSKKYASANKLFEYMASGIPVLVSNSPELVKVINHVNNGNIIDTITPQEIAIMINNLFKNPHQMKEQGENGRNAYTEHYNWKTQEQKLLKLFKFENVSI